MWGMGHPCTSCVGVGRCCRAGGGGSCSLLPGPEKPAWPCQPCPGNTTFPWTFPIQESRFLHWELQWWPGFFPGFGCDFAWWSWGAVQDCVAGEVCCQIWKSCNLLCPSVLLGWPPAQAPCLSLGHHGWSPFPGAAGHPQVWRASLASSFLPWLPCLPARVRLCGSTCWVSYPSPPAGVRGIELKCFLFAAFSSSKIGQSVFRMLFQYISEYLAVFCSTKYFKAFTVWPVSG